MVYQSMVILFCILPKKENIVHIRFYQVCDNSIMKRKCNHSGDSSDQTFRIPPAKVGRPLSDLAPKPKEYNLISNQYFVNGIKGSSTWYIKQK